MDGVAKQGANRVPDNVAASYVHDRVATTKVPTQCNCANGRAANGIAEMTPRAHTTALPTKAPTVGTIRLHGCVADQVSDRIGGTATTKAPSACTTPCTTSTPIKASTALPTIDAKFAHDLAAAQISDRVHNHVHG